MNLISEGADDNSRCCAQPQCKRSIEECMGIVKAGDILELLAGGNRLRELCEPCALIWKWTSDGTLTRRVV